MGAVGGSLGGAVAGAPVALSAVAPPSICIVTPRGAQVPVAAAPSSATCEAGGALGGGETSVKKSRARRTEEGPAACQHSRGANGAVITLTATVTAIVTASTSASGTASATVTASALASVSVSASVPCRRASSAGAAAVRGPAAPASTASTSVSASASTASTTFTASPSASTTCASISSASTTSTASTISMAAAPPEGSPRSATLSTGRATAVGSGDFSASSGCGSGAAGLKARQRRTP